MKIEKKLSRESKLKFVLKGKASDRGALQIQLGYGM